MARPLRIEYPGAWYHIMNRGRRREKIFFSDADRQEFIALLQKMSDQWNVLVAAYCLMSNHYHLLVHTPDGNLSRGMRHLNGIYTQRFNRAHKMEGQLFRGRYKAVLIEDDINLLEVLRYIHRNPVHAKIVKTLTDYPWTSHSGYLSDNQSWSWLHKKDLLSMLSQSLEKQKNLYLDFIAMGEPESVERFYSLKNLPSIMGSTSFKEYIRKRFSDSLNTSEVPEAKILTPEPAHIIEIVCNHYHVFHEQLSIPRRGATNKPRDVAVYLVRSLCRLTLTQVGKIFGIANYSTVSSIVQRVKAEIDRDGTMAEEVAEIRDNLTKANGRLDP